VLAGLYVADRTSQPWFFARCLTSGRTGLESCLPEIIYKLAFVALFIGAVTVRVRFQRLAGTYKEGVGKHTSDHLEHEARPLLIIRPLLGIPWYLVVLGWFFVPRWTQWSSLALPTWARITGMVLGGLGLLLLWRSHKALGANFRPTLEVSPDQQLITAGPYRHVRHPLYLAFLIMLASTGLIAANWFIGVVGVFLIASITVVRIPREEQLLRERFQERFSAYMACTPALLPIKIQRRKGD